MQTARELLAQPDELTGGELTIPPGGSLTSDHPAGSSEMQTAPLMLAQPSKLTGDPQAQPPDEGPLTDHPAVLEENYPSAGLINSAATVTVDGSSLANHTAIAEKIRSSPVVINQLGELSGPRRFGPTGTKRPKTARPEQFELPSIPEHFSHSAVQVRLESAAEIKADFPAKSQIEDPISAINPSAPEESATKHEKVAQGLPVMGSPVSESPVAELHFSEPPAAKARAAKPYAGESTAGQVAETAAESSVSESPPTEHSSELNLVGDTGLSNIEGQISSAGTPASSGRRPAARGRSAPNSPVANSSAKMDRQDYERLDAEVRRDLHTFKRVGMAFEQIRDRELWKAGGHASWAAYCLTVGGLTKVHANRTIKAAKIAKTISEVKPTGSTQIEVLPSTEWQIRPLFALKDSTKQAPAWTLAVKGANGGQPTAKQVSAAVAELMAEHTPVANGKPTRKQRIAAAYHELATAVETASESAEVKDLVKKLGELLNPA